MLVTSPDSNNTFTCNTVFSPHSTRKWYAKPFHKFLSKEQNVETITCSENASLSVYFDTLIPCFVRSVTGKNERCGKPDIQTTRDCPLFHVTACLFVYRSYELVNWTVCLLAKTFVNVCRIAVAICLWQPRRQQLFTTDWNTELVCDK